MATRTVMTPSGGNGSIGHDNGLDARTAFNAHRVAPPAYPAVAGAASAGEASAPWIGALAPAGSDVGAALAQRLRQLTQELSESRKRREQLQATLEKRTARVQQLIGERDRLLSLLAGRDIELQRLNRELGALTARVAAAEGRPSPLFDAARRLFHGLRDARKPSGRARPAAPRPQQPVVRGNETRLVPWVKDRPPKDVVAVVVLGLAEAELEGVLEVVERYGVAHDAAPLLLTDNDSFHLFRNRRVVFEYLPPRTEQQRLAPELDWQLFTLRRLALVRRKWRPVRVVSFGRRAAEIVQLWHGSPFEDAPLPASSGSRAGPASELAQHSAAA